MAIWQFDFYLGNLKKEIINDEKRFKEIIDNISGLLKKSIGWTESTDFYGNNDETCIQFAWENGEIADIRIRLDLRTLDKNLFNVIFKFIQDTECGNLIIIDEIIPIDKNKLLHKIRNSKEYSFVKNPNEFIKEIHEKENEKSK